MRTRLILVSILLALSLSLFACTSKQVPLEITCDDFTCYGLTCSSGETCGGYTLSCLTCMSTCLQSCDPTCTNPTCNQGYTCWDSGIRTCDGNTCWMSCGGTCGSTCGVSCGGSCTPGKVTCFGFTVCPPNYASQYQSGAGDPYGTT